MRWGIWFREPVLPVVIVNMKHDPTTAIRGVLYRDRGPWLELRAAAEIFDDARADRPIDGAALIPRANVAWVQALPPAPE